MSLLLAAAGVALGQSVDVAEPRRYAVVIGANEGASEDGTLRYAERDANRMADVLRQLGGVYAENLVVLRGPDPMRVRRVLREVASRAQGSGEGSVLLVFYSGHADADALKLGREELPFDELVEAIEAVPVDVRVVVVDACKSGSLTRRKGAVPAEPFEIRLPAPTRLEGTAIITSSSDTEDSQESERLRGGIFTHHLVTGLLGAADRSGDRLVSLREAYRYGYAETIRTTSQAGFVQHPSYAFELRGQDDVIITSLDGARRYGSLLVADGAEYVFFAGSAAGDVVADAKLEPGASLTLPAGPYWVRSRAHDGVREGRVEITAQATTEVARHELHPVEMSRSIRKGMVDRRRVAYGLVVGGGVTGPARSGLGIAPVGVLGLRLDGAQLSGVLRVRAATASHRTSELHTRESLLGVDVSAMRVFDVGPVSPAIGLRVGGDAVEQRFDTDGVAPSRQAIVGRVGSLVRAEVGVGHRSNVGLQASLDVVLQETVDATATVALRTAVVPAISLEWTIYAR